MHSAPVQCQSKVMYRNQSAAWSACRSALESDYVSANLHKWIDLNFGVALSGPAGLAAKNLHLTTHQHDNSNGGAGTGSAAAAAGAGGSSSSSGLPVTHGVCQLFHQPHPPRCSLSSSRHSQTSNTSGLQLPALNKQASLDPQQQQQRLRQPRTAEMHQAVQAVVGITAGEPHDPDFLCPAAELPPAPSPGQLAMCWRNIASLEAAAAVGSWQTGMHTCTAAAAGGSAAGARASQEGRLQQQQQLVPAFAADLAAVGHIAQQMYQQQDQNQQIVLSRSAGHCSSPAVHAGSSSNSDSSAPRMLSPRSSRKLITESIATPDQCISGQTTVSDRVQLGRSKVPASAALFIQQCVAGRLSARGLLHSSFFPVWMEVAWKFMVKLLYTEQLHSEHDQQHYDLNTGHTAAGRRSTSSSSDRSSSSVKYWQLCDAFESLARLAGPCGELQSLAEVPEAWLLCLPAVLHLVRTRLLKPQADQGGANLQHSSNTQRQQQQQCAVDFLDSVCVVLLRLASVLPPLLVQQQLVPLLLDMLAAEQQEAGIPDGPGTAAEQQQQQQQQESVSPEALRVSACRRAVLQPLLWQILLSKVPQQQLLQGLLPLLLTAVLEPQHDWLCPVCSEPAAVAGTGVADQQRQPAGQGSLLLPAAAAEEANTHSSKDEFSSYEPQQQQQPSGQAELAADCLAVLAESLPFPVVCQHILRPLLLALSWAGSTACTAHNSSSSSSSRNAVVGCGPHTHVIGVDKPSNGAAVALVAVGRALPAKLAAQFVYKRVLQLALLPVLDQPSAAVAASGATDGSSGSSISMQQQQSKSRAATVHRHTAAALPVLEGLLAHVLPVLPSAHVIPRTNDFLIPAYVPAAAAASSGSSSLSPAAAAVLQVQVGAALAGGASAAMVGPNSSSTTAHQQQQVTDVKLHQLPDLLLLLPPDLKAIQDSPLLYPRLVALLLSALDTATGTTAANSSSSGVSAMTGTSGSTSSGMPGVIINWLLPQVLLPLLSPSLATAWQQGEGVQHVYWRCVLLLYAAAVRALGLKEARGAVPAWHSIEVSV